MVIIFICCKLVRKSFHFSIVDIGSSSSQLTSSNHICCNRILALIIIGHNYPRGSNSFEISLNIDRFVVDIIDESRVVWKLNLSVYGYFERLNGIFKLDEKRRFDFTIVVRNGM